MIKIKKELSPLILKTFNPIAFQREWVLLILVIFGGSLAEQTNYVTIATTWKKHPQHWQHNHLQQQQYQKGCKQYNHRQQQQQ